MMVVCSVVWYGMVGGRQHDGILIINIIEGDRRTGRPRRFYVPRLISVCWVSTAATADFYDL